jgi:glycosyltransferase involved in cell wall biosynthesis
MKFLLAANVYEDLNTGTAGSVLNMGREIENLGHSISYYFKNNSYLNFKSAPLCYLAFGPSLFIYLLINHIRGNHFDVLLIGGGECYLVLLLKIILKNKPIIINHSHGPENTSQIETTKRSLLHKMRHRYIRSLQCSIATKYYDFTICSTENEKKEIENYYNIDCSKIKVIPLGIDIDYKEELEIKPNKKGLPKLLYVGSWYEEKGIQFLLTAYNVLCDKYDCIKLTIVGVDNEDKLNNSFTNSNNVNILPRISRTQLIKVYNDHDILILPSLREGFGLVVLEAMSQGLCVITTKTGFACDHIVNWGNGIIVPFRDSQAIYKSLNKLMNNPELINKIGLSARKTSERFTWSTTANLIVDECKLMLNQ